jgi:hypothetical protein
MRDNSDEFNSDFDLFFSKKQINKVINYLIIFLIFFKLHLI